MTNQHCEPTLAENTIKEVALQARTLRTCIHALMWTALLCTLMMATAAIENMSRLQPVSNTLFCRLVLLALPMLPMFGWMAVERRRTNRSCSKFRDTFIDEHNDVQQGLSSSTIGPLLDVTMTGAINGNFLQVPTTLLGDLLKSIRVENEVILTNDQRQLLHELVIRGHWDRIKVRDGPGMDEHERCALRPSAIGALALLGNGSSISVLERFARKTDDPELQQSALLSVEQIRERLRSRPEEMLRASRAPERPDTLLRAVSPDKQQATDSQELLRADNAPAELQNTSVRQQTGEQATPVSNRVKN